MNNGNKLIPVLRFPQFNGEWVSALLGQEAEIKGRIGYRGYTTADIVEKGKGAITLSPSNFDENGRLNFEKSTYITWEKYEESPEIMLEEGQTVLVKTASVGKTAYVESLPEKATVNPQIVVLKPGTIYNRFLAYTVSHQNTQIQIKNNIGAGAIPNISQEIISKVKILLPPDTEKKEQKKIADCLSSLDDLIAAHNQKLDALKAHKKGLMQQLFPAEGESVPKLRFKEFEKDVEWAEKTLSEVGIFTGGGTPSRENQSYWEGDIPWISSSDIEEDSINKIKITRFISDEALNASATKLVPKNSILIVSRVGVGKLAISTEPLCTSQDFTNLTPHKDNMIFLAYYLKSFAKNLLEFSQGMAIKGFTKDDISKLKLCIPSKKEQQKIASCLSALDEQIKMQSEKVEALKIHKKGLMQGLFPTVTV